jgi:hypothetical protein
VEANVTAVDREQDRRVELTIEETPSAHASLVGRCRVALTVLGIEGQGLRVSTSGAQARLVQPAQDVWDDASRGDPGMRTLGGSRWRVTYSSDASGGEMEVWLGANRTASWTYPRYTLQPSSWRQHGRLIAIVFPSPTDGVLVGAVSPDGRTLQGCEANQRGFPAVWEGTRVE